MKQIFLAVGCLVACAMGVYHAWFFSLGIISHGDRGYLPHLLNGHHALYIWRSVMSLGDVVLDLGQWSWQLFPLLGTFWIEYALAERIIFLRPSVLCATIGFFLLGQRIWKSVRGGVASSLVFCYSTYFLTLQTGHVTLAAGFSLFAFVRLAYDAFLRMRKWYLLVVTIILFSLCLWYEPRAGYIMACMLAFYTVFWRAKQQSISRKTRMLLLGWWVILVLLNLWRYLPLSHSLGTITDNHLFNRGLFGNQYFDLLYAFTLHHPRRDGVINKAFINQPIPWYFWFVPLAARWGFFVQRKHPTMQFFALLALLGVFLSKQVAPPGGVIYKILFEYFPGFSAFREASKFFVLIAMSYSVMIAWAIARLRQQRKLRVLFWIMMSWLICLSAWNTRSYISGTIESLFVVKHPSSDYTRLNAFLRDHATLGRTLIIPKYSRWMRYDGTAPRISFSDEINRKLKYTGYTGENSSTKIHSLLQLSGADAFLDSLAIRYVVLPMIDDQNQDNLYVYFGKQDYEVVVQGVTWAKRAQKLLETSKQTYQDYYTLLQQSPYLQELDLGMTDGTRIFGNQAYRPWISASTGAVQFARINPTYYTIEVAVPAWVTGVELTFLETYHEGRDMLERTTPFPCQQPFTTTWTDAWWPVTECVQPEYTFMPKNVFRIDDLLPSTGARHIQTAGYAQARSLEIPASSEITTLRYTLLFRPQVWVYRGLLRSGGWAMILLCYGVRSWRKRQ